MYNKFILRKGCNRMSGVKRKFVYLGVMPFLLCVNIMISFMGFNTTIILAPLAIFCVIVHISDRGEHFVRLNEWLKHRLIGLYPDIYQTGVMNTARLLLCVIPMIIGMLLNIPIANVR